MPSSDFDVVTGPPVPLRQMPPAGPSRSPAEPAPAPPPTPPAPSPDPRDERR